MLDFDDLEDAEQASSQNFNFSAFEDVFAKQNKPEHNPLDKDNQDARDARDLEIYLLSCLPWSITLPQHCVIGAKIKVRTRKSNSSSEQYACDAIITLARRIDSSCKKHAITCEDPLLSVYILIEKIIHGIMDEGEPVQDWFQQVFDHLAAFADALNDIAAGGGTVSDSSKAIQGVWNITLGQVKPLLKRLLECCMLEIVEEKDFAWSVFRALEGTSHSEFMNGVWLGHTAHIKGSLHASVWLGHPPPFFRTTSLTILRLLYDLRVLMTDEDFQRKYHTLRLSSDANAKHESGKLVMEVQRKVLPRYGFDVSALGVKQMREEAGFYAASYMTTFKLRSDIHYLLETGRLDLAHRFTKLTLQNHFKRLPLVSVVIPTHAGRLHLLRGAVLSAMTQTYGNVEVTISVQNIRIDEQNASASYYFSQVRSEFDKQPGVTVVQASETGEVPRWWENSRRQSRCAFVRNAVLKDIDGDFVAFLDDDDVWLRWKLSEQLSKMFQFKSECSATEAYGGDLHHLRPWSPFSLQQGESPPRGFTLYNRERNRDALSRLVPEYSPEDSHVSLDILKKHNVIVTSTVVMSCALLKRVGLMSITANNEDHDFWCRAADINGPILSIPEALSIYDCVHGGHALEVATAEEW